MRIFCIIFILLFAPSIYSQSIEAIDLGNRRELFIDSFMIEKMTGCRLKLHHPVQKDTAIKFDNPWEGKFSGYPTILEDRNILRMYYRGAPGGKQNFVTCYAESKDGIKWYKPNLGIYEYKGTKDNNIIIMNDTVISHNFSPFIDTNPDKKIKSKFKATGGEGTEYLHAYVSEDGINWTRLQDEPIYKQGIFDSQNMTFWSETENCYVMYFRTWTGSNYTGYRTISRAVSTDFIQWSDSVRMDFGVAPQEHLYTNGTLPYKRAPHIYIAMAKRFFPERAYAPPDEAMKYVADSAYAITSSDAVLFSTRGGYKYDRTFMESFILPGEDVRDWISRDNTPAAGIVISNDREMYIYRQSHYAQPTAHLTRYSLRIDGFASVTAGYSGGELITKPLKFTGSKLEINFIASPAGGIKVELQDEYGKPVKGFSLSESDDMIGDEISRVVQWNKNSNVSKLSGKTVKLRFLIKDGDIFSFRFFD